MLGPKIAKATHLIQSKLNASRLDNDANFALLMQCVNDQIKGNWTPAEEEALAAIAELRAYYTSNNNPISLRDFGSGKATDTRDQKVMDQGVESDKIISDVYRTASSSAKNGEFMFRLIRAFQPELCFELGTCLGISAAYGTKALDLNGKGQYITLEGSPDLTATTEESLKKFGFDRFTVVEGRFQDTLPELFKKHQGIDFAFIDGHHDEHATLEYFDQFYPNLADKALVIFDDINWSPGMKRAWEALKADPRVTYCLDNYFRGICLIDKHSNDKGDYKVWF